MADLDDIVRGMTKAQADAVLRAEEDGHLGNLFIRWWQANGRTLRALRRKGLGISVWSGVMLSKAGLEVRARLLSSGGEG